MQREKVGFIKDESKKQDSSVAYKEGHSSNGLSESKEGHFSTS